MNTNGDSATGTRDTPAPAFPAIPATLAMPAIPAIAVEHWEARAHLAEIAAVREHQRAIAAEERLEARTLVFAGAEHRVKNSLVIVQGWAATLSTRWDDLTNEQRLDAVSAIDRGASRAVADAKLLLESTRAEFENLDLTAIPVELGGTLERVVTDMAGMSRNHRLEVDCPAEPLRATADPAALETVIAHLLENAVKYSPAGGTVTVRCRPMGTHAGVTVEDEGAGLPPGVDVFAPFQRGANGDTRVAGSGLGLWLVRSLVRAMGGHISCWRNDPPPGSTFLVRLPLVA
jgi:signal transduction histidine kinase